MDPSLQQNDAGVRDFRKKALPMTAIPRNHGDSREYLRNRARGQIAGYDSK
jgi:hypothetical protein